MKNKIESRDSLVLLNQFDPEPYNYLYNKSTSFLDGHMVQNNHVELEHVLANFSLIDPDLFELLVYN